MGRVGEKHFRNYSDEEIRENIDDLVYMSIYKGNCRIEKPEIISVSKKQAKLKNKHFFTEQTVRFSNVGAIGNGNGYFLKKDVEDVVKEYVEHMLPILDKRIKDLENQVEECKNIKIRHV